jgi:hypothetical protein
MMIAIAVVLAWVVVSVPASVVLGFMLKGDDRRLLRFEVEDSPFRAYDRPTPVST